MSSTSGATHVAELVRALALGWKNLAAYPPGHPTLVSSLESIHRRLRHLRGPAGEVVLGIANDGLIFGDEKIDSMTAQKFAQALYARGVAILRFASETEAGDIEIFLRLLAAGTPGEQKRPIWEELTAAGVMHINLQPVDYSSVTVTDDLDAPPPPKERALWDAILRALLEGRELSPEAESLEHEPESADELTQMILKYVDSAVNAKPKFDPDATFGIRMLARPESAEAMHARVADAVSRSLAEAPAAKKQAMLQQAVQLLRSLPEPLRGTVLQRMLVTLARDESAGAMLRQLVSELPHDDVLEALRYLSAMGNLSPHAMNLIQSLSAMQTASRAPVASQEVISDMVRLFGDDDIDRFNTEDHAALLQQVSIHMPHASAEEPSGFEKLGKRVETVAEQALNSQVTRTILELLADIGASRSSPPLLARLESLFRSQIERGELNDALDLTEHLQEIAATTKSGDLQEAIHASMGRMAAGESIQALIRSVYNLPPERSRPIQRLIDILGVGARRNFLLALADEPNRSHRRRLFDFIVSLGPVIVPEVIALLSDSRWFVLRNMIVLLRAVNDRTSLPEIRKLARHRDLRVRMEAIKSLFTLDTGVPADLLENLIRDPDPKVSETAISLIGSYGIREGAQPLLRVLAGNDVFGKRRALRVKVIRALGELADPSVLPALSRFFTDSILPWPSREERVAAWESLSGYPAAARSELLERGRRSRNSYVREVCARMEQP